MTKPLFRDDAYLSVAEAAVTALTEDGGIILDQTNFYATSGGQPGDTGFLERNDGTKIAIVSTVTGETKADIIHLPAEGGPFPAIDEKLILHIDWERRYKLMRMHTACHLLSVVCPLPITGARVDVEDSRVDFDMSDTVAKEGVTEKLMALVRANHPIYTQWITDEELASNPGLVKSKNVHPPTGTGHIRLVCIGENASIDSQPCGGTHVSETQEVGDIFIAKIEKKGRENRRFRIRFDTSTT
ncbi:MAG: alanyl-tRNA editing protein [Pseudomonadota bacterium]